MTHSELLAAVSAHLQTITAQAHTIAARPIAATIIAAGAALGLIICGGAYNPDNDTLVLYIEK